MFVSLLLFVPQAKFFENLLVLTSKFVRNECIFSDSLQCFFIFWRLFFFFEWIIFIFKFAFLGFRRTFSKGFWIRRRIEDLRTLTLLFSQRAVFPIFILLFWSNKLLLDLYTFLSHTWILDFLIQIFVNNITVHVILMKFFVMSVLFATFRKMTS